MPIRFSEVVSVSLPEGKSSKAICFVLNDGESAVVPFTGGDNFSDSLEVLRFLDRVINDAKKLKAEADSDD